MEVPNANAQSLAKKMRGHTTIPRKKTLRKLSPTTRKFARLLGEQASVTRRLTNMIPDIQRLELDSQALFKAQEASPHGEVTGDDMPEIQRQILSKTTQDVRLGGDKS